MSIGSLVSRDFKFLEVDGLNYLYSKISAAEAALEPLVAAEAPAIASALVSAVGSAITKVFGPINGAILNTGISADMSGIQSEVQTLIAEGVPAVEGYVATFLKGIQARSAALNAEALATK